MKRKTLWIGLGASLLVCTGLVLAGAKRQTRLSYVVALVHKGEVVEQFLKSPSKSFVQAYFRFRPDLPGDVLFGLDQEYLDGIRDPYFFKGGDWMSFIALQRNGTVWIARGTDATMLGRPSQDRTWKILSLGKPLEPDQWYRIRIEADFARREYSAFEVEGPGHRDRLDLRGITVDYPNALNFSERCMTFYCGAFRGRATALPGGKPEVMYDDVTGGAIDDHGHDQIEFSNGFEDGRQPATQPYPFPEFSVPKYEQGRWYFERDEAIFRVESSPFARSGQWIGIASADLDAK